jgi:hypothetical protein
MIEIHPEILERNGEKQFVILPYEEFVAIQEALADADDLAALRSAKIEEREAPSVPLADVLEEFGISPGD